MRPFYTSKQETHKLKVSIIKLFYFKYEAYLTMKLFHIKIFNLFNIYYEKYKLVEIVSPKYGLDGGNRTHKDFPTYTVHAIRKPLTSHCSRLTKTVLKFKKREK